ncbi:12327_t:CDS:2, partial [Entrophospora sp. SA101]
GHYARDCRRKAKLANIEDEQQQQQQTPLVNNSLELTQEFVNKNQLKTRDVSPISVELADGTKTKTNKIIDINKLELGSYHTTGITAQVIKLQCYDVILGKPWLYHANPSINWRANTLTFQYGPKTIIVDADSRNTHKESS